MNEWRGGGRKEGGRMEGKREGKKGGRKEVLVILPEHQSRRGKCIARYIGKLWSQENS